MEKEKLKIGESHEKPTTGPDIFDGSDVENIAVDKQAIDIVQGVESAESNDGESVYDEKQKKYVQKSNCASVGTGDFGTSVQSMPSIEAMVKQTVVAIEQELLKTETEMKQLIKDKSISPHKINEKVIRIRFLNDLLTKLKRAATLTQEFIVGLWKQYVKKLG